MPRPQKCRRVGHVPGVTFFKPAGIPMRSLEEIQLSVEEAEALRLKELEGMEQESAAEEMNVSRPTFQRILSSARRKVADALLNGRAVRITGGNYEMTSRRLQCQQGHELEISLEPVTEESPALCPAFNTPGTSKL